MKAVSKRLFSLMLVVILLISAIPFAASAEEASTLYFRANETSSRNIIEPRKAALGYTLMPNEMPSESQVLVAVAAEGGAQDQSLLGWVAHNGSQYFEFIPGTTRFSVDMLTPSGNLVLIPVMGYGYKNITLDAKGGTVNGAATTTHKVKLGENYGTQKGLPVAKRDHYTFAGWFVTENGIEKQIGDAGLVESYANAYAKWTANQYVVNVIKYDIAKFEWEASAFTSATVEAGKTVNQANSSFKAYVTENAKIDGYEIEGWERVFSNGSVAAFDFNNTAVYGEILADGTVLSNITVRPIYKGTVTLDMCQMTNLADRTHTVRIGKPIGNLYNPGSQAGGVFMRWLYSNKTSEVKSTDLFNPAYGNVYYAEWGIAAELHLNLYNEDLKLLDTFDYSVPVNKTFNMSSINLDKYVSGYDKNRITWYDRDNWIEYKGGGNPQRT